ncbi:MAG: M1 family metallopeptidase [Planctomycetes bacterium]|nr:M1 family metallopeptidase [Planctomycetota bacterium]
MAVRLALLLALLTAGCQTTDVETPSAHAMDTHSHARPDQVRITHLDLDLELDFPRHIVRGQVRHQLERRDRRAPLRLDTDGLTIESITDQDGRELAHEFSSDAVLGRPLTIHLHDQTSHVSIRYQTAPEASALQWLLPEQTSGGKQPFLFTQGQAILTRSWIPLQDSPAVRATWTAKVSAPAGMQPVMSAMERRADGDGRFAFAMAQPVPSYLIALACGDLARAEISHRCAVWAEPATLDLAARELADTEAMVAACEQLFGPYRWGRYDVLILPPSFPFGGMENPCMTFATPTILAGDRSLVALIAHELAHSWSGNLVTNATWRDFWLNEGFTVFLENRIMEHVFGQPRAAMEINLGMRDLQKDLASLPPGDQVLHLDLTGRNPDDGMTEIAYQKGAAFLRRLEQVYGRDRFDAFLRGWFDQHAFTSVTTEVFLQFLEAQLLAGDPERARQVDIARWVRQPGLPDDAPVPPAELFAAVDAERQAWLAGKPAAELQTGGWVTQQWLRFLSGLEQLTVAQLQELDAAFALTRSGNSEILCAWLAIGLRNGYAAVDRRTELFLVTVGRRKFLVPLYEALMASSGGKERALAVYRRARPRYHAVAVRTLDQMLGFRP